jgi:hypothetical protein
MTTSNQFKKIKENGEKYSEEKARVNSRLMWRYYNEEGFKEKLLEKQKQLRLSKKINYHQNILPNLL